MGTVVDAGRLSKSGVSLTPVSGAQKISQAAKDAIDERLTNMETSLYTVARQLMLQRLALEESVRSDGHSGVKQVGKGLRWCLGVEVVEERLDVLR